MASRKQVFTLRMDEEVFAQIGLLATESHRSMTNYIEFVLIRHLQEMQRKRAGEEASSNPP